jgi:hypothetical protein
MDIDQPDEGGPLSPIGRVIDQIVFLNDWLRTFWSSSAGWAPIEAAELLSTVRLDRQVELSRTLRLWTEPRPPEEADARLILAWTNLGSLVEGTMQLVLAVYLTDFRANPVMRGEDARSDASHVMLDGLRKYFVANVWDEKDTWDAWVLHVQQRRNAIHSFRHRDLGTHEEFEGAVRIYLRFLIDHHGRLPYPDDAALPLLT